MLSQDTKFNQIVCTRDSSKYAMLKDEQIYNKFNWKNAGGKRIV